jgi:HSP20 family protein
MTSLTPWKRSDDRGSSGNAPVTQLRSDWDRMFDRFLDDVWGPAASGFGAGAGLPLDVMETDDALVLRAEIPGMDPKDIEIDLAGDVLTIAGQKTEEHKEERARYHHTERRYGSFRRSIRLPLPVEPDGVEAELKNGLLEITLRKAESLRPRRIEVKGSSGPSRGGKSGG